MTSNPDQPTNPLTREQIARIAHLARLQPTPEQADQYAAQLSRVLGYVDQLRALDPQGVAPMFHPHDQPARPVADEPTPGFDPSVIEKLAPMSEGPFIRVPKVLGGNDGGNGGGGA